MNTQQLEKYRERLLALRDRMLSELRHVSTAIQEEVVVNLDESSAPVHLADIAEAGVEADVAILQAVQGTLDDVRAALERIASGSFGRCEHCGKTIAEQRLAALPQTPWCAACAAANEPRPAPLQGT